MMTRTIATSVLLLFTLAGCNVFYPLNSTEPADISDGATNGETNAGTTGSSTCTASCNCESDCDVACESGCDVECESGATCRGNVPDGSSVECDEETSCEFACTGGRCEFECSQQSSDCEIDCPDGVACVLDCGTRRNGANRRDCGFSTCAAETTDCDDGIVVCGTDCP